MLVPDEASESLRLAVHALEHGHWDRRTQEGSRLNALDSIAWSLIGILGHLERTADAAPARESPRRRRREERDGFDLSALKPSA